MGAFKAQEDLNKYVTDFGSAFVLSNDGDTASVRFMYNTLSDVYGHCVHSIKVDGADRYVNCLSDPDDPSKICPLCQAKLKKLVKFFIPLYDTNTEEVKMWERGRLFYNQLTQLFIKHTPLVSTEYTIMRDGARGDINTTYETLEQETDGITLEDLPEVPSPVGSFILDITEDDMKYYLDNGHLKGHTGSESADASEYNEPRRRDNYTAPDAYYGARNTNDYSSSRPAPDYNSRYQNTNNERSGGYVKNGENF